jgi:hypothetical protein
MVVFMVVVNFSGNRRACPLNTTPNDRINADALLTFRVSNGFHQPAPQG